MTVTLVERQEALRRGFDVFGAVVHEVRPGQWAEPTPCVDWDVRGLVNHLVVEHLWVPLLLAGEKIVEVGDRFEGDQLGGDPVGRWEEAAEASRAAWAAPGAWERTVDLSFGPSPASLYASQMCTDLLIHAWDLARAVGAVGAVGAVEPADPELVRLVLADVEPIAEMARSAGVFGPAVQVPADSDDFARLLGITGRDPNWRAPGR